MCWTLPSIPMLHNTVSEMMTAALVVDAYVCTTLTQPPFPFRDKFVRELQLELKMAATMWSNRTSRSLYQLNTNIISFCEMYCASYAPLVDYASQLDDEENFVAARNNFMVLWEILQEEIKANQAACKASIEEVLRFQAELEGGRFLLEFNSDHVASKLNEEKNEELRRLQNQIDAEKNAMSEDMTIIASGAMSDVEGLVIAVGSLGETESDGGAPTVLVSSGLGIRGGVSEAIGLAAKHYNKKSKKLAQLTKESWKISDEITALNNLKSDLDRLMAHTDDVLRETIMMQTVWVSLEVEFYRITSFFNNNSNIILGTLHIGRAHCDVVGRTGYAIQNSLLHLQIDTSNLRHGVSPMVDGDNYETEKL